MLVMVVYVLLVIVGQFVAFFVGELFDSFVPATWSMVFYMGLFFGVIWVMWPVAVMITERWLIAPKTAK